MRATCVPALPPTPTAGSPRSPTPAIDLEVLMLGQLARQVHGLVGAPLWYHYNAADLLHLGVIRGAHPIQVSCNL